MKNNGKQRRRQRRQGALKRRQGDVAAYEQHVCALVHTFILDGAHDVPVHDVPVQVHDLERKLDIARGEVATLSRRGRCEPNHEKEG